MGVATSSSSSSSSTAARMLLLSARVVFFSSFPLAHAYDASPPLASDAADSTAPLVLPDSLVAAVHVWMAAVLLLLLGFLAVVYTQPSWLMDLVVRHSHPCVLWCVPTAARVCSLTVDDAPSATTPLILDLLRDHGVKATFFIISNNIKGNEDVVRRIVREGHRLGNHLTEDRASILDELHVFEQKLKECDAAIGHFQSHHDASTAAAATTTPAPPVSTSEQDAEAEQENTPLLSSDGATTASIAAYSATASKWLRPASGWFTTNMREIVLSHGYKICMGSVYPHDAQIKSERVNALFLRLRTRPGSVLIVHDRAWTVGVLRDALPHLVRKFKFVSLDELSLHRHKHKVKCAT